jgi:hypothetical protein
MSDAGREGAHTRSAVLQDAGQLRDRSLRQAMSVENPAKITLRAGIRNVLPRADPLHDRLRVGL